MANQSPNKPVRVPFFDIAGEIQDSIDPDYSDITLLAEEDYQQCRRVWPNLPATSEDFIDWLSFADADKLASIIAEIARRLASQGEPNPILSHFRQVILEQIASRTDADQIRALSGIGSEKSGSTATDHPKRPPRVSRKSRRRALPEYLQQKPNRAGFRVHVQQEQELAAQRKERASRFPYNQQSDKPAFAESPGALELFSIHEAKEIYDAAEAMHNGDNQKYIERRIKETLKHGNRRQLATAPSVAQIDNLRSQFPNAEEVINIIDRAAALSRLSPSQHFELTPLLIVGDPGIGKTAVVKAIAKSIATLFQRIDIATLSTGSQLFGTSLTWSTGRTGDIFNILASSPVLNVLLQLDEMDKAKGNDQSPVMPPLLSLLERETSKCFQDEAIPLTLNASHILWFATANELSWLPGPLKSRFNIVRIYRPEGEHALTVAGMIYRSIREENPWGNRFPAEMDRGVALRLACWTPREMYRLLTEAFGTAALDDRTHLTKSDIPNPEARQDRSFGFL